VQSKLRTSVMQHLLNPYERAIGVSICRHQAQCRAEEEWERIEHLRDTGARTKLLLLSAVDAALCLKWRRSGSASSACVIRVRATHCCCCPLLMLRFASSGDGVGVHRAPARHGCAQHIAAAVCC
jgi:hypothetical protein